MKYFLMALLIVGAIAMAEDIETLDHHVYKNVKITRVEPDGITVSHDTGISKIHYTELPDAVRSRFHFNPEAARAFGATVQQQRTQIYLQAHPQVAAAAASPTKSSTADSNVSTSSDSYDNLDSVATPKPVTLRSEIQRGIAALSEARRTPDSPKFREYVESIVNENKQKNTDTDGFCYGAYYAAWHLAWYFASNGLPDQFQQAFCQSNANIFYLQSKILRDKLKLNENDVQKVASGSYVVNENAIYEQVMNSKRYHASMPKR